MGLFQSKKQPKKRPPIDETSDGVQRFFDGYFAELRTRGRQQFEQSVEQNEALFKKDLDATVAKANAEIKAHITKRLDEQIAENNDILQDAQEQALKSLTQSSKDLQDQHKQLNDLLQKNIADQQEALKIAFDENKAQIAAMREAQASALQWLNESAKALQEQHQQLSQTLQKNVLDQETMLVTAFEENMAQIIEHYLLGALGDQYDLKAQLPAIIHQMETNKQAIVDDMKL